MVKFYTVSVKMQNESTIKLDVPYPYTIESAKQEISKRKGIPPRCQQLFFSGRVLEDGHVLTDYSKQDGSSLDLTVHGSKYCVLLFVIHTINCGS